MPPVVQELVGAVGYQPMDAAGMFKMLTDTHSVQSALARLLVEVDATMAWVLLEALVGRVRACPAVNCPDFAAS